MYHESIAANRFRMIKRTEGVSTTTFIGRLLAATRSKTLEAGATNQANPGVMAASVSASATLLPTGSRLTSFADGLRPLSSAKRVVCKFARPLMSFSWPLLTDGWLTGASGMGRRRRHLGRFPCRARGVSEAGNCNYLPEALPPPPFSSTGALFPFALSPFRDGGSAGTSAGRLSAGGIALRRGRGGDTRPGEPNHGPARARKPHDCRWYLGRVLLRCELVILGPGALPARVQLRRRCVSLHVTRGLSIPKPSRSRPSGLSRLSVPDSVCAGSWGRRSP